MVPLGVVVGDVFSDGCAEMVLAQQHELAEALALDGPHEAFGLGVQVGAARRQADRRDPRRAQKLTKGGRVQRVTIEDEEALAREKAVTGIEQIPRDLKHPCAVGLAG